MIKKILRIVAAVAILAALVLPTQVVPVSAVDPAPINLVCYDFHQDDVTPGNSVMAAIKDAFPAILIDNTPHSLWGSADADCGASYAPLGINRCMPAEYTVAGTKVYGYITGGYEDTTYPNGTWQLNNIDDLTENLARIALIAADGATGVFMDEVSAYPDASDKVYIQAIWDECVSEGIELILNTGVEDFDYAWLGSRCTYLMSEELWTDRSPTVSESAIISKILTVSSNLTNAADAADLSNLAYTNGFYYHYSCSSSLYTLPTWLGDYVDLLVPPAGDPPTSTDVPVAASEDDGFSDGTTLYNNQTYFFGGNEAAASYDAYFRFLNLGIPADATITSATMAYVATQWDAGTALRIYAEDAAAPTQVATAGGHASKTRTTEFVAWETGSDDSAWHDTPDFTDVVQELVDTYGAIDAIQILVDDNGSEAGLAAAGSTFDNAGFAPELTVTYTVPEGVGYPSISTSAASSVTNSSARLNGNVTDTGEEDPTVTVYWGDNDGGQVPGSWDFSTAPTSPAQPQGVAAFYKDLTGLDASTTYYFNAKATNSAGTVWGTSRSFTTASSTTVTFYSSGDGYMYREALGGEAWATITAGNGTGYINNQDSVRTMGITSYTVHPNWTYVYRAGFFFDTSSLPDGAVIDSATFSIYGAQKQDSLGITPNLGIYGTSSSNTNVVANDYEAANTTLLSNTLISYGDYSLTGYNDFALNAAGLAEIDDAGYTRIITRNQNYDVSGTIPSWSSLTISYMTAYESTRAGTSQDPKLVITYHLTPSIVTDAASNIAASSARLNATITDDGGSDVTVRFGWGETSEAAIDDYDHTGTVSGTFVTGQHPYLDVDSLTPSTTYYFMAECSNVYETAIGSEDDFATEAGVGNPSDLMGIPSSTSVSLTWVKGTGATNSLVRYGLSDYPASEVDGFLVYNGTSSSCMHSDLIPGTTYHYSVWGESGGVYSASFAFTRATTEVSTTGGSSLETPLTPTRWLSAPDYTTMSNLLFFYDGVNGTADSLGMPRETLWLMLALLLAVGLAIMVYMLAGHSMMVGMITLIIALVFGWAVKIVPFWIPLLTLIMVIGVKLTHKEVQN